MQLTTASLRPGRLRAYLEQRIEHNGAFLCRLAAIQEVSHVGRWEALADPIVAQEQAIEDDLGWSPPPEDDLDLDLIEYDLFQKQRAAEALRGLNMV